MKETDKDRPNIFDSIHAARELMRAHQRMTKDNQLLVDKLESHINNLTKFLENEQ